MKKRWKVSPFDKVLQERLARDLEILPLTARLLINRGLVDSDRASSFLSPGLTDLHDPFLLKDMDKGVRRVREALENGEGIAVYGDYDVDGTSSTALLYLFFKAIGVEVTTYIPDRKTEGYALNIEALKALKARGVKVVITVDCGTSNHEEIAAARALGMDVVVTDHHEPTAQSLPACAFINPRQEGCAFPFKSLAGVGVAFNLVMALRSRLRESGFIKGRGPNLKRFLDLVAIGTVSDMVPLVDENRVFVRYGLKELADTDRPGLIALKEVSGLRPGPVETHHIAFKLAPRLNAAGRIAKAELALSLLVSEDESRAGAIARELDEANTSRRKLESDIMDEALAMVDGSEKRALVLFSSKWHQGVIGIVASRLTERFGLPVVMIAVDGEVARGSARGVRAFNMLEGIINSAPILLRYGGHRAAAGFSVSSDKIDAFKEQFLGYAARVLSEDDLIPEVELDARVTIQDMNLRAISEIEKLAPFGVANREPLLCLTDTTLMDTKVVGGRHLRFRFRQDGAMARGIGFGMAGLKELTGEGFSLAFSPYTDMWGGAVKPGFRIREVSRTSDAFAAPVSMAGGQGLRDKDAVKGG